MKERDVCDAGKIDNYFTRKNIPNWYLAMFNWYQMFVKS